MAAAVLPWKRPAMAACPLPKPRYVRMAVPQGAATDRHGAPPAVHSLGCVWSPCRVCGPRQCAGAPRVENPRHCDRGDRRAPPTSTTFTACPPDLTVLFVPGGLEGGTALMNDPEVLAFLQDRGQRAQYVTSVCTGSLLLGAAGLFRGYRATSHWTVRELLPLFGAEPWSSGWWKIAIALTAGGVTAGIDFGLGRGAGCAVWRMRRCCNCSWDMLPSRRFRRAVPKEPVPLSRMPCAPACPALEPRQAALVAQQRLQAF